MHSLIYRQGAPFSEIEALDYFGVHANYKHQAWF